MTKFEKLKIIERAYFMLIPCLANNVIQDYALVCFDAPNLLKEMIEEERINNVLAGDELGGSDAK